MTKNKEQEREEKHILFKNLALISGIIALFFWGAYFGSLIF